MRQEAELQLYPLRGKTVGVFGGVWKRFPVGAIPEGCHVIYEPARAKAMVRKLQSIDVVVFVTARIGHNACETIKGAAERRGVPYVYTLAKNAALVIRAATNRLAIERGEET